MYANVNFLVNAYVLGTMQKNPPASEQSLDVRTDSEMMVSITQ